jgi:lipopolysaccharide assembly protein A
MITLILVLLIGAVFVYLAQNNLVPVTLHIGATAITNIPLFYIIIGSLLTGLVFAYLIHLVNAVFVAFSMHRKDTKIKQGKNTIADLTKRIHQLELENERLKNDSAVDEPRDSNAL